MKGLNAWFNGLSMYFLWVLLVRNFIGWVFYSLYFFYRYEAA